MCTCTHDLHQRRSLPDDRPKTGDALVQSSHEEFRSSAEVPDGSELRSPDFESPPPGSVVSLLEVDESTPREPEEYPDERRPPSQYGRSGWPPLYSIP